MNNKQKIVSLLCVISLSIASCASTPTGDSNKPDTNLSVLDNIQKSLDTTAQQKSTAQTAQLPADVADALLPTTAFNLPAGTVEKT